jgi:predicted ester cyclase
MSLTGMAPRSPNLRKIYKDYINCLNDKDYDKLPSFLAEDVEHNGKHLGSAGYVQLIKDSYAKYPWLHYNVALLAVDETDQIVSARLILRGDNYRQSFEPHDVEREHVWYHFVDGKIRRVLSMLDGFEKADAIKSELK